MAEPSCSNLTAIDDVAGIKIQWDLADPAAHQLPYLAAYNVEVWASETDDREDAVKIGEGWTDFSHQGLPRGAVRTYWVRPYSRWFNAAGVQTDYPWAWFPESPTAGVQGTELSGDILIATNGYWKHPSGLIEQWGRDSLVGGGSTTITFPLPFPNQCFQVIPSPLAVPSTTILYQIEVETFDSTTVALTPNQVSAGIVTSPALTALWRAIGY